MDKDEMKREYAFERYVSPLHLEALGPAVATEHHVVAHIRRPSDTDRVARASLPEALTIFDKSNSVGRAPLFTSFYTADTPYEAMANGLRRSLEQHSMEYRIEAIPSLGDWVANTGLKASFIEKVWHESDRPICWLDADSEIIPVPYFLFSNPFDIAFVRRRGWYDISCVVYIGKSNVAGRIVTRWADLCRSNPHVWDQVLLTLAWFEVAREYPVASMFLPDTVLRFPRPHLRDLRDRLFYYPQGRKMRPFFNQKQASRTLKAFVSQRASPLTERGSDNISSTFRTAISQFDFKILPTVDNIFDVSYKLV